MKKILFYYHHFGGLGHGMRIYTICKAIKKYFPTYQLLVINSGVPQRELNISQYAKIVNLPYFKAKERLFSGLHSPLGLEVTFKYRKGILKSVAEMFKPHLAVFEHFPFGRDSLEEEIIEFINLLQREKTLIYSSVRDIVLQKIPLYKLEERLKLFNGIFVHSDKQMGFKTNFRKSEELKKKIIFTGRVFPITKGELIKKESIRKKLKCDNRKLITISIGGGIDGFQIIEQMLRIKSKIDKEIKTFYLISTGPSFSENYFRKLKQQAKNRNDILIKKFITQFPSYINASDLYISMGGYNSINNALFTGTKTIVFPRLYDNEQKLRARYFSRFLNIGDIHSSSNVLAFKIINIISQKKSYIKFKGKFRGADITARLIDRILNLNYIKIRLTTRCNLNCDMCSVKLQKYELNFSCIKQIIDRAKLLNVKTINFTGGEPSLYLHFYELIRYVKKQSFYLSISTNGIMNRKDMICLSKFADYVDISLHSYKEEIDDKIKGRDGVFRKTVDFIRNLNKLNKNIKLQINVTVRPDNLENIHQIIPLLSKYIYSISFTLVDTSINKLEYLKFRKEQLYSYYFNEVPLILKECIVNNNIRLKIKPFFKDLQNINNRDVLRRLLIHKKHYISRFGLVFETDLSQLCPKAKSDLRINANGEVCPCCYLDDYPIALGNIYKSTLLDIVSSDKYFNFINSAKPNKGWCRKCAVGYKMYSKFFKHK